MSLQTAENIFAVGFLKTHVLFVIQTTQLQTSRLAMNESKLQFLSKLDMLQNFDGLFELSRGSGLGFGVRVRG